MYSPNASAFSISSSSFKFRFSAWAEGDSVNIMSQSGPDIRWRDGARTEGLKGLTLIELSELSMEAIAGGRDMYHHAMATNSLSDLRRLIVASETMELLVQGQSSQALRGSGRHGSQSVCATSPRRARYKSGRCEEYCCKDRDLRSVCNLTGDGFKGGHRFA